MIYVTRDGRKIRRNDGQDAFLAALYGCRAGRLLVGLLVRPAVSKVCARYLDSPFSKWLIKPFVRKNEIDLDCYEKTSYRSYNDFFARKIKEGQRPIDKEPLHFISPCDAKLTVCPIERNGRFYIKHTVYTAKSLLRDAALAKAYEGGQALIFRLTVDDYHHYCYIDSGIKSSNREVPGVLHTVNPAANDVCPIYKENTRQYCLLKTRHFGTVMMMEVGALMVGRIVNYHQKHEISRGLEKGHFEFGGSTVILFIQPGKVAIAEDILKNSAENMETIVHMGEKIGCALQ